MLCCFALFVCLTLLASFFLPSHLSLKICIYIYIHTVSNSHSSICLLKFISFLLKFNIEARGNAKVVHTGCRMLGGGLDFLTIFVEYTLTAFTHKFSYLVVLILIGEHLSK